jgi:hypothetical protein
MKANLHLEENPTFSTFAKSLFSSNLHPKGLFELLAFHLAQFEKLLATSSNFLYSPIFLKRKFRFHLNKSFREFLISHLKELNNACIRCTYEAAGPHTLKINQYFTLYFCIKGAKI